MKNILITGGCGFIGSNLIEHFTAADDVNITVFDNESLGKREHIAEFDVRFIHGDIQDQATLAAAIEGMDTVVHLAADTRVLDSIKDPLKNFQINVVGSFNLLSLCRDSGVERIVSASTGGAIVGEAPAPIHEDLVAHPLAPYGASKLAVEGYCSAFVGAYGMDIMSLRFSNVYGPRSYHKGSVVAHFFKQILSGEELVIYGDGRQVRDYIFVKDLCAGIHQALVAEKSGVFQLGTGKPTELNELIDLMKETIGDFAKISVRHEGARQGEIHKTWCDISKARRELEFDPGTSLSAGLQQTWHWFLSTA